MTSRPRLPLLLALVALAGCAATPVSHQGVVECQEETLAFAERGHVAAVLVAEGQRIADGVEVARLDGEQQRLGLAVADADLRVAQAQLAQLRTAARPEQIAAAEAQLVAAQAEDAAAATDLTRLDRLYADLIVTKQGQEVGVARLATARAAVVVAQQRLAELRAGGATPEVAVAEAQVAAAQARQASARDQVAKTVLASVHGARVVRHIHLYAGMWADPGVPALTVADLDHPYVDVFVPQAVAAGLKPGQAASARFDQAPAALGALPGPATAAGTVERVGERLEYTPRFLFGPADRPHLMIRVRVRLSGAAPAAGVPADVTFGAAPAAGAAPATGTAP